MTEFFEYKILKGQLTVKDGSHLNASLRSGADALSKIFVTPHTGR